MTTTAVNNASLNGPPSQLQLPETLNRSFSNFTTNQILGNHLDDLYQFLRESEWNTTVVPLTIFLSVLMGVGTVGNGLVIVVSLHTSFASRKGGSASTRLVVSLAVTDLAVCVMAMPGQIVRAWYVPWRHDFLCKAWELLRHAALPISAVILVAIAHDRYRLICRPTSPSSLAQSWRTFTLTMLVAGVMGLAFGVPAMLAVGVNQRMGDEEYYLGLCEVNGLILSEHAMTNYWRVLVSFFILVLILLLVIYSAILFSVWKHASFWNRRTKGKATPQTSTVPNSTSSSNKAGNFIVWNHRGTKVGTHAKLEAATGTDSGHGKHSFALSPVPDRSENSAVKPPPPTSLSTEANPRRDRTSKHSSCELAEKASDVLGAEKPGPGGPADSGPVVKWALADSGDCAVTRQGPDRSSLKAAAPRGETCFPTPLPTGTQSVEGFWRRTTEKRKSDSDADSVSQSCSSMTLPGMDYPPSLPRHPQRLPHLVCKHSLPLPTARQESYPHRSHNHHQPHLAEKMSRRELKTSTDTTTTNAQGTGTKSQVHKQPYRAHVKTAAIFFLVTITFLASYVPTFLMIVRLVPVHPVLYYTYLIHATANPLLYSAANKNFRSSTRQLFNCCV